MIRALALSVALILVSVPRGTCAEISRTVVVDPQYGGKDSGPVGVSGTLGKDLSLQIARDLARHLTAKGMFRVVLTRTKDHHVSLENRIAIANAAEAEVFISIGLNGFNSQSAKGMETYILSETNETATIKPLEKTSRSDLEFILSDLTSSVKSEDSARLAASLHTAGIKATGFRDRGLKSGLYYVLIGARMPSVMAMLGFITNPREEGLLTDPAFQNQLAGALAEGVWIFFNSSKSRTNKTK